MIRVVLNLRAESPVSFRGNRDAARSTTLPYIPGSVLLGGFAGAHTLLHPDGHRDAREQFAAFFVQGRLRFGNAYPASFPPTQRMLQDDLSPVRPLPATARSCKRWPGFRFQCDPDHEYHGVFDHLIAWTLFAVSGEQAVEPLERIATCTECGASIDAFAGFYRRGDTVEAIGRSAQDTILITRTGLSRATGAVHTGIIYSREALAERTDFWSELTMPDELFDEFREFADEASGEGLLRLGTNRTRGLGRLAVTECHGVEAPADTAAALGGRVESWNQTLRQAADEAAVTLPPGWYIPITLTADALVFDPLLRWRLRLDGDALAEAGVPVGTLVYQSAGVRRVSGWNGLWGLPREDALAIEMGSVFLLHFEPEPDFAALLRLQEEGIGERRAEGFGQLSVADRFHWEVENA